MVSLKRVSFDKELLSSLRKKLRARSNGRVFNLLPLQKYSSWLLSKLQKESGRRSPQNITEWLRYIRSGGESSSKWAEAQAVRFEKGWRNPEVQALQNQLVFTVDHELSDHGSAGRERFLSIIKGTSFSTYRVKQDFRFEYSKDQWIRFRQGETLTHEPTDPNPVISKVNDYVKGWLAQQINRDLAKVFL